MSAETLRQAAALMRERAEAATAGPWDAVAGAWGLPSDGPDHMRVVVAPHRNASDAAARAEYDAQGGADANHIASWHPAVALAVADWLDAAAERAAEVEAAGLTPGGRELRPALAVATAYLGDQP